LTGQAVTTFMLRKCVAEDNAVKLYYTPGSPFSRMIRVLLRELAIECAEVEITEFPPPRSYFAVNPLGQVPALEAPDGVRFPTRIIIDYLVSLPRGELPVAVSMRRHPEYWQDDRLLAVLLGMGDAIVAIKYQHWTGLGPASENLLGYELADRNMERIQQTLDWLETMAEPGAFLSDVLSVQDIALACIIRWTEARGGIPWRGRPKLEDLVETCASRPSFRATEPQPWP
jgi:glutathione S-transferase